MRSPWQQAKVQEELNRLKDKLKKADIEHQALEKQIKTRPAGDTPELLRKDLQRLKELNKKSRDPIIAETTDASERLVSLQLRLDELKRRESKP